MKKLRLLTIGLLSMMVAVIGVNAESLTLKAIDIFSGPNDSLSSVATTNVTGNDAGFEDIKVVFSNLNLQTVEDGSVLNRPVGNAWVGFKVHAPEMDSTEKYKNVKYSVTNWKGVTTSNRSFWDLQDTPAAKKDIPSEDHYIEVYGAINEENLTWAVQHKTKLVYTWVFEWNEETKQTITLEIDPNEVKTLEDKQENVSEEEKQEWNGETSVNAVKYDVEFNVGSHGSVTASPNKEIAQGTKVKLTVSPNEGYRLYTLSVKDAEGNDVTVTNDEFTMPDSNVTVSATFRRISTATEDKEPEENKDVDTDKEDTSKEENPNTLDNVGSVVAISGLSLVIAALGIISLRKREN